MDEFKLQFHPRMIKGGSMRKNEGYGRKHYVAGFMHGRRIVHESRVSFKRAQEAQDYANEVIARYLRLAQAALLAFMERQNVESTN